MNKLAITGHGIVHALGTGRQNWQIGLQQAARGELDAFSGTSSVLEPSKFPNAAVAEVWDFDPTKYLGNKGLRNLDRLTKFLITAARLALQDSGIKDETNFIGIKPEQIGLCSSTAYGSLDAITELNMVAELENPRYLNPARFPNTVINAAAGYVSIWEDLRAPNVTLVNGNCGGIDVVLSSETHLGHNRADVFLIGGGEVISEPLYLAFETLGVVAKRQTPWHPGREQSKGIRLGEGAAYLCVERPADAEKRGARIEAEIVGYGTAFEPPMSEAEVVHASPKSVVRAIQGALKDADLRPDDIDLVCGACGGLWRIDSAELAGIQEVFADVPIVFPKTWLGESFGAAGAFGMTAAVTWMHDSAQVPVHLGSNVTAPKTVIVLAVGYYGNVSAAIIQRPQSFNVPVGHSVSDS